MLVDKAIAVDDFESLYRQIEAANRNGAGRIALNGDVTLGGTLPAITGEVSFEGKGFSISGDNAYRIFDVAGGKLTVKDLTLIAGKAPEGEFGGAIRLSGSAQFSAEGLIFSDNSAANGGAIAANGAGTDRKIAQSVFVRNHSSSLGGALFLKSGMTDITQSSFQRNGSDSYAGAIAAHDGKLTVSNSTFSGNSAYIGGVSQVFFAEATFKHVTMISNRVSSGTGAAIHRTAGVVNLYNSIVDGDAISKACTKWLNPRERQFEP